MKRLTNHLFKSLGILLLLGGLSISCNKDFKNLLQDEITQPEYNTGSNKVLFILVDGLSGNALQRIEPPALYKMSRNSLYTYSSLADFVDAPITQERAWANIFLGVDAKKHNAVSDIEEADTDAYPSFIKRIKELNSELKIALMTPVQEVHDVFGADADDNILETDDESVFKSALGEINDSNTDLIISHFTGVEAIGEAVGYDEQNKEYVDAVHQFDTYVKDMVNAIEERETYEQEDWLVIISSTTGGSDYVNPEDQTHYGSTKRNTFTYFYSPKFSRKYLGKPNSTEIPYQGEAVQYHYNNPAPNAVLPDNELFNFGNNEDFTLSLFIKSNEPGGNWNYPIFFSKRDQGFSGNGWNLFGEVRDGNMAWGINSNIAGQAFGSAINDGEWHAVTVVVKRTGGSGYLRVFTDGEFNQEESTNSNNLNNSAPLVLGKKAGNDNSSPNFSLANVQIYGKALTNEEVATQSLLTEISEDNPHWNDLLGYWPGYRDVGTNKLTDLTDNQNDFGLERDYHWVSFSKVVPYFRVPLSDTFYRLVPNGVDLSFFVYQWFGVIPSKTWSVDGKSWTPDYRVNND